MGNYQKFRGDPEQKLFYLLNNFMGGINTEFSDDSSNDVDFESIINFDMDKLGTLNKRGGFGELTAISEIFNKLNIETELPSIYNRTEDQPNPEKINDNVVYMKLIRNDNNCFRALSGFSGENAYRKYQEMYGFQNNKFVLLMLTTKFAQNSGDVDVSTAWLYQCTLPELEYEDGEITDTETMTITCNKIVLPIIFNWDRNLMNIETIEFYDKIYFTGNNKCLLSFDRSITIESDADLETAFNYSGFSEYNSGVPSVLNSAYVPSGLEVRHVGFNVLCDDPMHSINTQGITTDSIQGIYVCTMDNIPLQSLPLGQKFLLNIIYTGEDTGFNIEMKDGENPISFSELVNSELSQNGLKVYEIQLKDPPKGEVEIKITKLDATLEPYYDYYNVAQVDPEAKAVVQLNVGDYGLCEMYNRAVFYKDDTIWFSEVNNFKYIPNYNYVTLAIEPTDKITKIIYFKKAYVIFTKQRIYKMTGSFGTNEFAVSPVNMSLGCHAGNTVIPIEDTLYFASPRGLYALKSNTFIEGYENVKELDLKVKKLTSDFTKYDEELTNPAVRFNGISERAYALRYKDKYLLFYNNYTDKGDYAAINDLDTLAYQFDIGAYTTYRFKEKPTFLFMVDNAIETLATVAQDEIYTDEKVVFDYDLTQIDGNIIEDQSESGNDATAYGDIAINQGAGISLDGTDDYVKINSFNGDIADGFTILIDTKLNTLNGAALINLQQGQSTAEPIYGTIETNTVDGFKATLNYSILPNILTGNDTVRYQLTLTKENNLDNSDYLTYSLVGLNGDLISTKEVPVYFTPGTTNYSADSGTFKISRDANFNYTDTWTLNVSSSYTTTTTETTQVIGADVNIRNRFYETDNSNIQLGFGEFKAVGSSTGCTITYKPAVKSTLNKNIGTKNLYVYIDNEPARVSSISIPSSGTFTGNTVTVILNYSGSKTIQIKMTLDLRSTVIDGAYIGNVTTPSDEQYITLPSITTTTVLTPITVNYNLSGAKSINLTRAIGSYREISLIQNDNLDQLTFKMVSENGEAVVTTPLDIGLTQRHIWKIVVGKGTTDYTCTIYKEDDALVSQQINSNIVVNSIRDDCYLGTDTLKSLFMDGDIYAFIISSTEDTLLSYMFNEGTGTQIIDTSINRAIATLIGGVTWITVTGFLFNGINTYLQLPEFNDVYFSNGFKMEFSGIIGENSEISRIIDLATSYKNDGIRNKNCSINIGVKSNLISFNSTSKESISYRLTDNIIDFSTSHDYIIDCVNNGNGYTITLNVDDVDELVINFNYGGITDVVRSSNFIGKSNTTTEGYFKGVLTSFKLTVYASSSGVKIYRNALYEFDTTSTDFGRPMYIELKTKAINMKYPQHLKKLKHIFVKAIGGYDYGELFFLLYGDGYRVNDPEIYDYYIDEATGTVVQEYREVKDLTIDERISLLGNMRLDYTKLGEGVYQMRKLIIPKKAKNFQIFTFGESSDYLSIESFGFVCKLGKVKEG